MKVKFDRTSTRAPDSRKSFGGSKGLVSLLFSDVYSLLSPLLPLALPCSALLSSLHSFSLSISLPCRVCTLPERGTSGGNLTMTNARSPN